MVGLLQSIKRTGAYWRAVAARAFIESFKDLWGTALKFMAVVVAIAAALIGWLGFGLPAPNSVMIGALALLVSYLGSVAWKLFSIPARLAAKAQADIDVATNSSAPSAGEKARREVIERIAGFIQVASDECANFINYSDSDRIMNFRATWIPEVQKFLADHTDPVALLQFNTARPTPERPAGRNAIAGNLWADLTARMQVLTMIARDIRTALPARS